MGKTVAIDFDGVIHKYSKGWHDGSIYDDEIQGVFEVIKKIIDSGHPVVIMSTRSPKQIKKWLVPKIMISEYERDGMGNDPARWVEPRFGFTCKVLPKSTIFHDDLWVVGITDRKVAAMCYVDDRAIEFEGNWPHTLERVLNYETLKFIP